MLMIISVRYIALTYHVSGFLHGKFLSFPPVLLKVLHLLLFYKLLELNSISDKKIYEKKKFIPDIVNPFAMRIFIQN